MSGRNVSESTGSSQERTRQRWRRAALIAAVMTLLAALAALAFDAMDARERLADTVATLTAELGEVAEQGTQAAQQAADAARRALEAESEALALQAQNVYETEDQILGLSLALEANRMLPDPPPLAQRILAELAYAPGPRRALRPHR